MDAVHLHSWYQISRCEARGITVMMLLRDLLLKSPTCWLMDAVRPYSCYHGWALGSSQWMGRCVRPARARCRTGASVRTGRAISKSG